MSAEQHFRLPACERAASEQRCNGHSPTCAATDAAQPADVSADAAPEKLAGPESLTLLLQQLAELREYASSYAAARLDSAKASVRNTIIRVAATAVGFVTVGGLVVMASWFVLSGMAQGLGTFFGDRSWIGTLLTGLGALVGIGAGVRCVAATRRESARKRTVEKYEARQAHQRARFGRDAHDGAPTPVSKSE